MRQQVFVDTSFWVAFLDRSDQLHLTARRLASEYEHARFVTTELILVELLNHFSRRSPQLRQNAVRWIQALRLSFRIRITAHSWELFEQSMQLYSERSDKQWSVTDCASFVIMQRQDMKEALTADHHFEQAGFIRLLK